MRTPAAPQAAEPRDVEWWLACHPRSAGRARGRVRGQAEAWGVPEDVAETAVLLVSELVTNAVRHSRVAGRYILARCVLREDALRVEVGDAGDGVPVARAVGEEAEGGRGLALVDALAAKWGTEPRAYGIGKTVWFELVLGERTDTP